MPIVGVNNSFAWWGASTADGVGEWIAEDSRRESDGFAFNFLWSGDPPLSERFNDYPQVAVGSSSLDAVLGMYPADWDTKAAFMGHYPGHIGINAGISDINDTAVDERIAVMEQIVDAVEAMGALPWLTALTPADGGSNGTNRTKLIQLRNLGYYLLARKRNIPFLNGRALIVDGATGGWAAGMSDGAVGSLHASEDGAWEHGAALAREVRRSPWSYPQTPHLADANDADSVLAYEVDNPLFLTDTGGDGEPDGWGGTFTSTLTAPTTAEQEAGVVGNWWNLTSGTATRTITGQTAGNWLYVAFRWKNGPDIAALRVRTLNSSSGNAKDLVDMDYTSARAGGGIVVVIQPMPVGNDRLNLSFGGSSLSISQLTICDLSANGLEAVATGL